MSDDNLKPSERLGPIILITNEVLIRAYPNYLLAKFFYVRDAVEKKFPHIEDLYNLPLRGLVTLAEEFYDEVKCK